MYAQPHVYMPSPITPDLKLGGLGRGYQKLKYLTRPLELLPRWHALLISPLLLTGCLLSYDPPEPETSWNPGAVDGTVDGQEITISDAYFTQWTDSTDDVDQLAIRIDLSTVQDCCAMEGELLYGEDTGRNEIIEDLYPADSWHINIYLWVEVPSGSSDNVALTDLTGELFTGVPWEDQSSIGTTTTDGAWVMRLHHYVSGFESESDTGGLDDHVYINDGGSLRISGHDPTDEIIGTLTAPVVAVSYPEYTSETDFSEEGWDKWISSGEHAGEPLISFDAPRCREAEW